MAVKVRIPTTLRPLTGGNAELEVDATNVNDVLLAVELSHPGFGANILDEEGGLRRFVNVFVDDEDVRFIDGISTQVSDGTTVAIVPAVAGG
jgi:molybdopterin synthase sulfur carrier subunit